MKRCISMWRDSNPIKIGSVLVFVEKQEKADMLFKDLLKRSYPCLSLHGGKIVYNNTLHTFTSSVGLNFRDLWMNRKAWPFTGNLLSSTFLGARWFQLSSLWLDYWNENFWVLVSVQRFITLQKVVVNIRNVRRSLSRCIYSLQVWTSLIGIAQ